VSAKEALEYEFVQELDYVLKSGMRSCSVCDVSKDVALPEPSCFDFPRRVGCQDLDGNMAIFSSTRVSRLSIGGESMIGRLARTCGLWPTTHSKSHPTRASS